MLEIEGFFYGVLLCSMLDVMRRMEFCIPSPQLTGPLARYWLLGALSPHGTSTIPHELGRGRKPYQCDIFVRSGVASWLGPELHGWEQW